MMAGSSGTAAGAAGACSIPRSLTSLALESETIDHGDKGRTRTEWDGRRSQISVSRSSSDDTMDSPEDDKVVDVVVGWDELVLRLSVLGSSRVDCRADEGRRHGRGGRERSALVLVSAIRCPSLPS